MKRFIKTEEESTAVQDKELLEQLQTDPDGGMRSLIAAYGGLLTALIRRILPSPAYSAEDVEDCAAESLSEAFFHLADFRTQKGSLKAWLCVIARNNARDLMRRRRKEDGQLSLDAEEGPEAVDEFSVEADFSRQETKALLLNDPCNPTGAVYSEAELRSVVDFCAAHDLWIIADEVYGGFVYDGKFVSLYSFPEVRERLFLAGRP